MTLLVEDAPHISVALQEQGTRPSVLVVISVLSQRLGRQACLLLRISSEKNTF